MSMGLLGRRRLLGAGLAAATLPLFTNARAYAQEMASIRMIWRGGDERA